MAKITKVEDGKVFIEKEDGSVIEADRENIDFAVKSGMEVDISDDGRISKSAEPDDVSEEEYSSVSSQPAMPAVHGKAVNKVAYCLLAFFLGGLGIHKFYAGKTLLGVLYGALAGAPLRGLCLGLGATALLYALLLAFLGWIIGLCKHADSQGNIYF